MTSRKYYEISMRLDSDDGCEANTLYVGCNRKEAIERYIYAIDVYKKECFLDLDYNEDDIDINKRIPSNKNTDENEQYCSYLSTDGIYLVIEFRAIKLNTFYNPALEQNYNIYKENKANIIHHITQ